MLYFLRKLVILNQRSTPEGAKVNECEGSQKRTE